MNERLIPPEFVDLPKDETGLREWCLKQRMIGKHMRLVPGLKMIEISPFNRRPINGTYGLEQLDAWTGQRVARCGFSVLVGGVVDITHTPQGNRPESLEIGERQRLRSRDFRSQMLTTVITIARSVGANEVRAIYSGDHYGLRTALMKEEEAYHRLDEPFEQLWPYFNFKLKEIEQGGKMVGYWGLDLQT